MSKLNSSLADISYEDGLQRLALRKAAIDQGLIKKMTKEALANTLPLIDMGSSFFNKLTDNDLVKNLKSGIENIDPNTRQLLLGSAAGAGLGAAGGLGTAAFSRRKNKSYLNNMLLGAGLGGVAGGGLAALMSKSPTANTVAPSSATAPSQSKADAIMNLPITERLQKIKELEGNVNINPELTALGLTAGTVGGTGGLVNLIRTAKRYNPSAMADALAGHGWQIPGKGKNPPSYPTATSNKMTALARLLGKPVDEASLVRLQNQIFGAGGALPQGNLRQFFERQLPQQTTLQWLTGAAPGKVTDNLASVLGSQGKEGFKPDAEAAKEMLGKAVKGVGFNFKNTGGGLAKSRLALAGLTAGLGLLPGLSYTLRDYLSNRSARSESKNILSELSKNINNTTP